MRRVLAVLAAAVLIAALCVPAGAFTDSERIGLPYAFAVEAMSARGILNGFPDGSFRPDGTLTREQGAKIVTYIVLGGTAETLSCSEAPFEDVAADRWSAPCISWCAEREILLGYGDGRFGPEDLLTGDQFAKMLLCALELARDGNYVGLGDRWFFAVREDGDANGLYAGDDTMQTDRILSRAQASLMAYNAIRASETPRDPGTGTPQAPQSPQTSPEGPGPSADPAFGSPVSSDPASQTPGPQSPGPQSPTPQTPDPETTTPWDTGLPVNPTPETPEPGDIELPENPIPETPDPGTPRPDETELPVSPIPETPAPEDPAHGNGNSGDIVLPEIP